MTTMLNRVAVVAPVLGEKRGVEGILGEKFLALLSRFSREQVVVSEDQPAWTVEPQPPQLTLHQIPLAKEGAAQTVKRPLWLGAGGIITERKDRWDWAQSAAARLLQEHQQRPFDLIISRYLPIHGLWAGMVFRQKSSIPWLHNFNDPYPGWCQPSPTVLTWNGLRIARDLWLERKLFNQPRSFFTYPSRRMKNWTIRRTALSPRLADKLGVLHHIGIPARWRRKTPSPAAPSAGEDCTFRYVGVFSGYRDPYPVIQGWKRFQRRYPACSLEIYGNERQRLSRVLTDVGQVENVHLCDSVSYQKACQLVQDDCVLVQLDPYWATQGFWVAGKLSDYMSTDNVICGWTPLRSEIRDLCNRSGHQTAWVDTYGADAFARCFEQARQLRQHGLGPSAPLNLFSEERIAEELLLGIRAAQQDA